MRLARRQLLRGIAVGLAWPLAGCDQASVASEKGDVDPLAALRENGAAPNVLRIGITPSRGPETHTLLEPLFAYLEGRLGIEVSGITATSYAELATLIAGDDVELGVFSPAAYATARATMSAIAIATATQNGSPTYLGYIVSRLVDGAAPKLAQLAGKRMAWVEPNSTSGYIYPRAMLRAKGYDPDKLFPHWVYAGHHDKAVQMVIDGEVDVAAVASPFVDPDPGSKTALPRSDELTVVAKTRRIPLDCVAIHTRIKRSLASAVRDALLAMVHDPSGPATALENSWGLDGFVKPMDYDEVDAVLREHR